MKISKDILDRGYVLSYLGIPYEYRELHDYFCNEKRIFILSNYKDIAPITDLNGNKYPAAYMVSTWTLLKQIRALLLEVYD